MCYPTHVYVPPLVFGAVQSMGYMDPDVRCPQKAAKLKLITHSLTGSDNGLSPDQWSLRGPKGPILGPQHRLSVRSCNVSKAPDQF